MGARSRRHRSQAALIFGLQTTSAGNQPMAGFASRPSFTGYADCSASERHPLTFKPDHPMGAANLTGKQPVALLQRSAHKFRSGNTLKQMEWPRILNEVTS
jgi:hypothetical protein